VSEEQTLEQTEAVPPRPLSGWEAFSQMPAQKQIMLVVILAMSIAAIIAVSIWAKDPHYRVLYSGLDGSEVSQIMDALAKDGVSAKLDEKTNAILVPSKSVYSARITLSSQGLPNQTDSSLASLTEGSQFGMSNSVESARLNRLNELEIARSIKTIQFVKDVRVHIAQPSNSVFVRERGNVSASVVLTISKGNEVSDESIQAITHLITTAVPRLKSSDVSIVDQHGNLLSKNDPSARSSQKLKYKNEIEYNLEQTITSILTPIVGANGVIPEVTVLLKYEDVSETSEKFGPSEGKVRSEDIKEDVVNRDKKEEGGVPGALTNQPEKTDIAFTDKEPEKEQPKSSSRHQIRNFEMDKTITHKKFNTPLLERISAAVVIDVDYKKEGDKIVAVPRSEEEIQSLTELVKKAIDFNQGRGDSVVLISKEFKKVAAPIENDEFDFLDNPAFVELAKFGIGLLVVLLIVLLVIRPLMSYIMRTPEKKSEAVKKQVQKTEESDGVLDSIVEREQNRTASEKAYDAEIREVQNIVKEDPQILSQVVRSWVVEDED